MRNDENDEKQLNFQTHCKSLNNSAAKENDEKRRKSDEKWRKITKNIKK